MSAAVNGTQPFHGKGICSRIDLETGSCTERSVKNQRGVQLGGWAWGRISPLSAVRDMVIGNHKGKGQKT
jgi:hypothetical protein